jgi:hypothetical protein
MKTRAKNKNAHPGVPDCAPPRRTIDEVQNERAAKAQVKAAKEEKRRRVVEQAAEFELADMANEDVVDATPRPSSFSKSRLSVTSRVNLTPLTPVGEVSGNPEDSDDDDTGSYEPHCSAEARTEELEESAAESDPPPPAKKLKAQTTRKAIRRVDSATRTEEGAPAPDEDSNLAQKPKKAKPKVRDEICAAKKKIDDETRVRKEGGDMVTRTSSQQGGEERSGTPAPEPPSQVQPEVRPVRRGALKRVGAIADISALTTSQQSARSAAQRDDNNFRPRIR